MLTRWEDNMSLYGDYIKEHHGDEIIETEHGFATYRYLDANGPAVYIVDIYVIPELRQSHCASKLADEVAMKAMQVGCKKMIGSVVPSAKNSTASLKVLLGYGMRLKSSSDNLIIFEKDL